MPELHHLYHLHADGDWRPMWDEHGIALGYGLGSALASFHVGITGAPDARAAAREAVTARGATVVVEADTGWEQVSLNWLHAHLPPAGSLLLYCHTKGAANAGDVQAPWRRTMTHDLVLHWTEAIAAFTAGTVDAVGSFWHPTNDEWGPHGYFAGNFWWATSAFLATLGPPHMDNRHGAESWLGTNLAIRPQAIRPGDFRGLGYNYFADDWLTTPRTG